MGPGNLLRETWEMVPILLLLLVGGVIALRSGVNPRDASRDLRQVAGNLTHMVLRVLGYVGVFLAIQQMIGLRPALGW
jgi:hypothetical protein